MTQKAWHSVYGSRLDHVFYHHMSTTSSRYATAARTVPDKPMFWVTHSVFSLISLHRHSTLCLALTDHYGSIHFDSLWLTLLFDHPRDMSHAQCCLNTAVAQQMPSHLDSRFRFLTFRISGYLLEIPSACWFSLTTRKSICHLSTPIIVPISHLFLWNLSNPILFPHPQVHHQFPYNQQLLYALLKVALVFSKSWNIQLDLMGSCTSSSVIKPLLWHQIPICFGILQKLNLKTIMLSIPLWIPTSNSFGIYAFQSCGQ